MDYEKKYLKYKMKYEELKNSSNNQEGGWKGFPSRKKLSPEEQAASDANKLLSKHNDLLEKQLNKQLSDMKKTISSMTHGLNKTHENQVMMNYKNVFGERKWGRGRDGVFRQEIKTNKKRTNELKDILSDKLNNTDLQIIVKSMIQNGIDQVWKEVAEQVPNIAKQNPDKTSESIGIMTDQLHLNNVCTSENIKKGYPECTKEKIEDKQNRLSDFKKEVISYHNEIDKLNKHLSDLKSSFNKLNQPDKNDLLLLKSSFNKINQPNKNDKQKAEKRFDELYTQFLASTTNNKQEAEKKFIELHTQLNKDLMLLLCKNISSTVSDSDCSEIFIYQSLFNKYKKDNDTNKSDFIRILRAVLGKLPEGLKLDNQPVQSNSPVRAQSYDSRTSPRSNQPVQSNSPVRAQSYDSRTSPRSNQPVQSNSPVRAQSYDSRTSPRSNQPVQSNSPVRAQSYDFRTSPRSNQPVQSNSPVRAQSYDFRT